MIFPKTIMIMLRYNDCVDAFAEVRPGEPFENVCDDIFRGDFGCDRVLGVYEVGLGTVTIDVSGAVCRDIIERIRKGQPASQLAKDFVAWIDGPDGEEILNELQAAE
jgi:hypothetical protein